MDVIQSFLPLVETFEIYINCISNKASFLSANLYSTTEMSFFMEISNLLDVIRKSKTSNTVFLFSFHFYFSLHSFLFFSLFSLSFIYLKKLHLFFYFIHSTLITRNFSFIFFFPFCLFAFFSRIGNESPGNVYDEAQWCFDIRWLQFRTKTFLNCPTVDSS